MKNYNIDRWLSLGVGVVAVIGGTLLARSAHADWWGPMILHVAGGIGIGNFIWRRR